MKIVTYLLSALLALSSVGFGVQTIRLKASQTALHQVELKSEAASKKYTENLLEQERLTSQRIANLTTNHLTIQEEANEKYEDVLADLRTTKLRLRDRFVCPKPYPGATTDPSGSADEAPTGLLEEDVQFLVSEAKRADDVVRQITLTQELLVIYKRHYDELRTRQK